jgi:hypothetical protein
MDNYPYARRRRLKDPIVELAVDYAVPNIVDYVLEVSEAGAGEAPVLVWKP